MSQHEESYSTMKCLKLTWDCFDYLALSRLKSSLLQPRRGLMFASAMINSKKVLVMSNSQFYFRRQG